MKNFGEFGELQHFAKFFANFHNFHNISYANWLQFAKAFSAKLLTVLICQSFLLYGIGQICFARSHDFGVPLIN